MRVGHSRRRSAGPGGVDESEHGVVAHLLHQGEGVHEIRLRLAGEAHDDVRGQHQVGHIPPGLSYLFQILRPVVMPVHLFQDAVGAGLEGQVDVVGAVLALCHRPKELFRGVLGVAGHEPQHIVPRYLIKLRQQVGEIRALRKALAVAVHVLTQQGDVLIPRRHQRLRLGDHVCRTPAALPAPDIGHDAVGAEVVATVHDGKPRLHGAVPLPGQILCHHALRRLRGDEPALGAPAAPALHGL